MALFTDEPINRSSELQAYETNILNVASTEGIDVTVKAALAQDELGTRLHLFLKRNRFNDAYAYYAMEPHIGLQNIAVIPALKRWHAYKTLALVYRDAYNNNLNDRYKGKWDEYETLAASTAADLFAGGVGIVSAPMAKASVPVLTTVAAGVTGTTYYAAVSWIGSIGQEGEASDVVQATSADGSTVQVSIVPGPGVRCWNLYAGSTPDGMTLQNISPMAVTGSWAYPASGLVAGRALPDGQLPDRWICDRRILQRG